jgi:hypothetical protein
VRQQRGRVRGGPTQDGASTTQRATGADSSIPPRGAGRAGKFTGSLSGYHAIVSIFTSPSSTRVR